MAITTAMANSFKAEILQGVHEVGDTYMMALYVAAATLNKSTTVYAAANEVANGNGYVTGGKVLTGIAVTLDGDVAFIDWADPVWANSTITARGCLIYNATQGNKAVAAFDFGGDIVSTNGNFTAVIPAPAAATGVVRVA